MKRLLAYLFLVVGLGLVFSVNANSYTGSKKIYLCGEKSYREVSKMYNRVIISKIPCKKILSWRWKKISGKEYVKRVLDNYGNNNKVIQSLYDDFQSNNLDTSIIKKIAKTYPTQTQQVAEKEIESITVKAKSKYRHSAAISINEGCKKALERAKLKAIENAFGITISSAASSYDDVILHGTIKELKKLSQTESHAVMDSGEKIYTCNVEIEAKVIKNIETQITKKEPKKKEKKLVKLKICGYWVEDESPGIILDYNKVKKSRSKRVYNAMIVMDAQLSNCSKFGSLYEVISYKDYFEKSHRLQSYLKKSICFNFNKKTVNNFMSTCQADELALKYDGEDFYYYSKATQIAKKEPTIKPKEEFKPVDKDIDNDPPRIEIAEAITVVSQSYKIKGLVKDKSKPIYVEINGRPIEVKNGKFELERFNIDPDVVEELKIVAIDQWNNKSEKLVKVTVKLQSTEVVRTYEELKPTRVKVKTDKDKIAIIIGIEKYKNQFECVYCNRDAKAFREYATRALGVKSSNIKLLVDSKATRPEILKAFKLWLPRIAGENKDIYIFFAGHGLASDDGNDLYILPQDGESSLLEDTAISRVELISLIQKNNPKSVTMFFDTCYSGQTRDERMLVASLLRPIIIVADEQDTPDNFTIFSASNFDQTSGSIKEAQQGMFSYYLMKGLEGKADGNQDKQITNGELIAYLKTNVSKEAFSQAREQDPMLSGDPNQVLMRY